MKNKATKHKSDNIFKFQSFSERIAAIDINIFHKVKHPYEEDEESVTTYFYNCIEKWSTLNCSESYKHLCYALPDNINTLPQLLIQKEHILNILIDHIKQMDIYSLQPALELITALARDLRKEFYPYFLTVLGECIQLLNTKDVEQIEWVFVCLAHLFKYLFQYIVKNINEVLKHLLPLLKNSEPYYISDFSAQSFAYVARKVKDIPSFLKQILKNLKNHRNVLLGCSKLIFESIKGVNNQFHSCATNFISCLLQLLDDATLPQELLYEVFFNLNMHITRYITQNTNVDAIWDTYLRTATSYIDKHENKKLCSVLKSVEYLLRYKGYSLHNKKCINIILMKSLQLEFDTEKEELHEIICNIISSVSEVHLRSGLPIDLELTEVISLVLDGVENETIVSNFIERMLKNALYKDYIISAGIHFCEQRFMKHGCVTKIIRYLLLKFCMSTVNEFVENIPLPNRLSENMNIMNQLLNEIPVELDKISIEDIPDIICSLMVTSRIEYIRNDFKYKSYTLLNNFCNYIEETGYNISKEYTYLFLLVANNVCNLYDDLENVGHIIKILTTVAASSENVYSLTVLNQYLKKFNADANYFNDIKSKFSNKLSSPLHKVRLFTADILSKSSKVEENIYVIMHRIESIESSVEGYRSRLQQLSYLEYNDVLLSVANEKKDLENIIHYLLGNLFINFQLLWQPVQKLLISHAECNTFFWPVFESYLKAAVEMPRNTISYLNDFNSEILNTYFEQIEGSKERIDYNNFRCLLWKTLSDFINFECVNHQAITDQFLTFINDEYNSKNSDRAMYCNLKKFDDSIIMEIDEDIDDKSSEISKMKIAQSKNSTTLLLAYLEVFSNVSSPQNTMGRELDLFNVYYDLLHHRNPAVQKAVITCIFTYNYEYITPYKEHLYGLINNKTFKDELLYFRIDDADSSIQPEHRTDLVKIVMRLVYGKMLSNSGRKSSGQHQREQILRFLSGCRENELITFVRMVFNRFDSQIQDDALKLSLDTSASLNIEKVLPPKQFLSATNMAMVLLNQCGALLKDYGLSYILRVLIVVGANVMPILLRKPEIHSGYIGILTKLRIRLYDTIIFFYEQFEMYSWTDNEIEAIFQVFVWPPLSKLKIESLHNPSYLMKLIITWSRNPIYHALLVKRNEDQNVLDVLIDLFQNDVSSKQIKNIVLEIIREILLNEQETRDQILEKKRDHDNIHTSLLLPYTTIIMTQLQNRLNCERNSVLTRRELFILSEISSDIRDNEQSSLLLQLLIPILKKKSTADDDILLPYLKTVLNLINNVINGCDYVKEIAHLFVTVTSLPGRQMLQEIISLISTKFASDFDASIICGLNCMDKRYVDQPDYNKRLETLNIIHKLVDDNNISMDAGILIIYNCFFMIQNTKDIALRDNSVVCLKKLCPALCFRYRKQHSKKNMLLDEVVLPLIRNGINGNNESFKYESVLLLGHMARKCGKVHPVLRDLSILVDNSNTDMDFFENIQHLQTYQKMKALHRFCEIMSKQIKCPRPRTVVHFLFPLASQFLLTSQYSNKNTLIDAAIDMIKIICKLLPWRQYEKTLKFYLSKMRQSVEFQKQAVRIVSNILDAFHFDISLSSDLDENKDNKNQNGENITSEQCVNKDQTYLEKNDDDMVVDELETEQMEQECLEDLDTKSENMIPAVDKQTILTKSDATRISHAITTSLIPYLDKCFVEYTESYKFHKLNKKYSATDREEMEVLTIPMASAIVKLLNRLPPPALDKNISSIFMKLCTYLKSRLQSIRLVARQAMQSILLTIGPAYLPQLLSVMSSLLTRGFHVHVLVFTSHAILESVKHLFSKGDIDLCLDMILELCMADLFGQLSDEKEISKIVNKTPEARGNKSSNMLNISARYVSEQRLLDLIMPLKEVLFNTLSRKTVLSVSRNLGHISVGLVENKFISTESLLIMSYGIVSESIPMLTSQLTDEAIDEKMQELSARRNPDCFIIPAEPKNIPRVNTKLSAKTNAHVLMEFGLQILHVMLKREMIKNVKYQQFLEPFIPILCTSLQSQNVKLNTYALMCISRLFKHTLTSLQQNIPNITCSLFQILHKHVGDAHLSGENADLVMAAFKAVSVLVRDVKYHRINDEQLRALLLYVEQGVDNYTRKGTSFTLLKAILLRKHIAPELQEVMKKVSEISIRDDNENIRLLARQCVYQYMLDYPLGKQLSAYVSYYASQLNFFHQSGRLSALEMLRTIAQHFPLDVIKNQAMCIFIPLCMSLINDDVAECKMAANDCITVIIRRLQETPDGNKTFESTLRWMNGSKVAHRTLAMQLIEIFINVEGDNFSKRLTSVLPAICKQFDDRLFSDIPGKYVKLKNSFLLDTFVSDDNAIKDHCLFSTLQLINTLLTSYSILLTDINYLEHMKIITDYSQQLLAHPHEWVRLSASKVISHLFAAIDVSEIKVFLSHPERDCYFFGKNIKHRLESLSLDFCDHLIGGYDTSDALVTQAMKNLSYISEIIVDMKHRKRRSGLSLTWLICRVIRQIKAEVAKSSGSTIVRMASFTWFLELASKLTSEKLVPLASLMFLPLVREIKIESNKTDSESILELRKVAKQVLQQYRVTLPQGEYTKTLQKVTSYIDAKKCKRRVYNAQQAVLNPENAAKRKLKLQLKKKIQKRRRIEKLRNRKIKSKKFVLDEQ